MNFITLLDYVGTFAFAISGIRLASAKHFDWFGAYVVGFVTAVGGGTLRDLLLGLPPFWMQNVSYLVVSGFAFLFVVGLRKYVIRLITSENGARRYKSVFEVLREYQATENMQFTGEKDYFEKIVHSYIGEHTE